MACDIYNGHCEDCPGEPKYIYPDIRGWIEDQNYNRRCEREEFKIEIKRHIKCVIGLVKRILKTYKKFTLKDYQKKCK